MEHLKAADITEARTIAAQRCKLLKLHISYAYGHELINWEMPVYFDNIGLVLQHIEALVLSLCGLKNARPKAEAKLTAGVFALSQNTCGLAFQFHAMHFLNGF